MRDDVLVEEVLAKCDVLKQVGLWPSEPTIRPRAWLDNFDENDIGLAAFLLDKFTFYNHRLTDALLVASYHSIGDGSPKGPSALSADDLIKSLETAIFTPVLGESPNPTDSGNLLCRKARQILNIPEELILNTRDALEHARAGNTVVFLDDFIGSGDQFLKTWRRINSRTAPMSFAEVDRTTGFTAIYISLVTTDFGLRNIHTAAPNVAVCATHILGEKYTINGLDISESKRNDIKDLLKKYSTHLRPKEEYIAKNPDYLAFGYKSRSLMFGFEHSIPDATLPIFWSPGIDNWEPLVERV